MIVLDPDGTLLKVALFCLLAGVVWSVLGAAAIFLGSTRIAPRIPPGQIWAEWRRRRVLWVGSLLLTLIGAFLTAEQVYRRVGLVDLYWITKRSTLEWIARLGVSCGYLLVVFILVMGVLLARSSPRRRDGRTLRQP